MWGTLVDDRARRSAGAVSPERWPTRMRLGALDAIHLASALSIATPDDRATFVTFDRRLRRGGARRGARGPARGRLGARGRHARPHRRRPAPVPARPHGDRRVGPRARARGWSGWSGATVTAVEAQGKNLLIRFDNGLEIRTHLRMHGSWHRYRPGERWRRAAGPGAARASRSRARSPSASTPRRSSCSSSGPRRCTRRCRGSGRTCSRSPWTWTRRCAGCGTRRGRDWPIAVALLDQRALAGIGNEVKNEVLWQARRLAVARSSATWTTPPCRELVDLARDGPARGCRDRPPSPPRLPPCRPPLSALRRRSSASSTRAATCPA